SNVDEPDNLETLVGALSTIARRVPILFPVHPRVRRLLADRNGLTWRSLDEAGELPSSGMFCLDPIGYLDFVALMSRARLVLTDSGGIQEETTSLRVPCLTLRHSTERPVTVTHGTNRIV